MTSRTIRSEAANLSSDLSGTGAAAGATEGQRSDLQLAPAAGGEPQPSRVGLRLPRVSSSA